MMFFRLPTLSRALGALSAAALLLSAALPAHAEDMLETPSLAADVAAGKLPPVAERIPADPLVTDVDALKGRQTGKPGGTLRMLMARSRDTRQMNVYGYARLMRYDEHLNLVPDILKSVDVEGERVFTLHLRAGHRWSDGAPFTAEDFRWYWEDYVGNKELSPYGPPRNLMVDGEGPTFEVLDDLTVRYSWKKPNPFFLPALAGPAPLYIYQPAHYLRQFHAAYSDPSQLAAMASAAGKRNWAQLYNSIDKAEYQDNPDLPTLQPWILRTRGTSDRFLFTRNPYFHRIDTAGHQLPYIDKVIFTISGPSLIAARTATGEADLQGRYLSFGDYTFLKQKEKASGYDVRLWRDGRSAQLALLPNLNTAYPEWEELFRDVRFRRALSMGIDREEINQVIYFGLGTPAADAVLPESPLFDEKDQKAWIQFDPDAANALLDEMGLTKRDDDGIRLLSTGEPMQIVVDTAGEAQDQTDALELIAHDWLQLGIKLFIKPSQREIFNGRIESGEAVMSIWSGHENGVPSADNPPWEFAPTTADQYQWPQWGQYYATRGVAGFPPDLPEAQKLLGLYQQWIGSGDHDEREQIWSRMISLYTDQVFTIGLIAGAPQPIVVSRKLRNVPEEGLWNWDPGAHFGIHRLDLVWFAQ